MVLYLLPAKRRVCLRDFRKGSVSSYFARSMVPACLQSTYVAMYIPWRVPSFEGYTTPTPSTISHNHLFTIPLWAARHSTAPLRSAFALPSRGGHASRVPPSAFAAFSSGLPRSVICEDHLTVIIFASVAKLCISICILMHICIIDHAAAIYALPIH